MLSNAHDGSTIDRRIFLVILDKPILRLEEYQSQHAWCFSVVR